MATPADNAEYPQQLQELQEALRERDQVVQMLTQRLEQAADQLDRWQRTGSERRGSSAGISSEVADGQQTLFEQMTRVLGEWEELQAAQMLSRIESQILELKELVSSRELVAAPSAASSSAATKSASAASTASSTAAARSSNSNLAAERQKSSWEVIRASMMADETLTGASPSSAPVEPEQATPAPPEPIEEKPEPVAESKASEPLPPLPVPPRIIDVAKAPVETLREAVESRDDFILALLRRVAAQDQAVTLPNWEKLNQAPVDLRRGLEDLQQRLQETLRVAEVDLSMQRAKLAREEMKLQVKAEQVTRQMRQLGMPTDEANGPPNAGKPGAEPAQNAQGRRWLQFLQRSSPGGAETDDKAR